VHVWLISCQHSATLASLNNPQAVSRYAAAAAAAEHCADSSSPVVVISRLTELPKSAQYLKTYRPALLVPILILQHLPHHACPNGWLWSPAAAMIYADQKPLLSKTVPAPHAAFISKEPQQRKPTATIPTHKLTMSHHDWERQNKGQRAEPTGGRQAARMT
jgi:hypothetical protein